MASPSTSRLVPAGLVLVGLVPLVGLVSLLESRFDEDAAAGVLDPARTGLAAACFWLATVALVAVAVGWAAGGARRSVGVAALAGLTLLCGLVARDRLDRPDVATAHLVPVWAAVGTSLLVLVAVGFRYGRSVTTPATTDATVPR